MQMQSNKDQIATHKIQKHMAKANIVLLIYIRTFVIIIPIPNIVSFVICLFEKRTQIVVKFFGLKLYQWQSI